MIRIDPVTRHVSCASLRFADSLVCPGCVKTRAWNLYPIGGPGAGGGKGKGPSPVSARPLCLPHIRGACYAREAPCGGGGGSTRGAGCGVSAMVGGGGSTRVEVGARRSCGGTGEGTRVGGGSTRTTTYVNKRRSNGCVRGMTRVLQGSFHLV